MSINADSLEKLIEGGLIGAALGALLAKDKEEGAAIGALLGAAFSSTLEANKAALQTDKPVLIAEDGKLYRLYPNGDREFVKNLPRSNRKWPAKLNLK